ncbi:hypothetical protein [Robiginitalea sp. IMCC43444]|uniref:hypothetical protein n=1 Tax=Robiginitalea sp. IMCC43444 TaxID=3459121 RepID=UPI0040415B3E
MKLLKASTTVPVLTPLAIMTVADTGVEKFVSDKTETDSEKEFLWLLSNSTELDNSLPSLFYAIKRNVDTLDEFLGFPENWNGHHGEKFSAPLIGRVKSLVQELKFQPEIFPTGRGSIQLEYDHNENYLEIEIFENQVQVLIERNDVEIEKEIAFNQIDQEIENFFSE